MLPAGDLEGNVVERDDAAEAHADVPHPQQSLAVPRPPPSPAPSFLV